LEKPVFLDFMVPSILCLAYNNKIIAEYWNECEYYRIIEWLGLEGTLKTIVFQTPCHGQRQLPPDQVAQSPVQPGLGHFQGGGIHSFSGQPVLVPHHPRSKELLS